MPSIIYSPKEIYEQEFKTVMRGFDKTEVDEFLDNVINDYELFIAEIENLKAENERLKAHILELDAARDEALHQSENQVSQSPYKQAVNLAVDEEFTTYGAGLEQAQTNPVASNFDILKRISRLEREVFGKHIEE